jgi:pSer/pThr/pTyr-binding forkhead associated (FHA) protein
MPSSPSPQKSDEERTGTLLETDDEIGKALRAKQLDAPSPSAKQAVSSKPTSAEVYRPTFRPPIGFLTLLDDGESEGELIRIRAARFVIGRSEGALLIPHDGLISGRHLEITRQQAGGKYRWTVTDLQTRNGLFVRVSRASLADRSEFLVGKGKYRFQMPRAAQPSPVDHLESDAPADSTGPWAGDAAGAISPVLFELQTGGAGERVPLTSPEYWIGSDPACAICRADDPFVEPRHVRLFRDVKGGWHAQNNKSPNGLWLRVPHITVQDGCLFQIGEQRFRMKVGG